MRIAIRMPQLGEAAAEATVVAWLAAPGAAVKAEQDLLEVQTEKSLLTVASPADGVLLEACAKPGSVCKVGEILGWVGEPGAAAGPAAAPPGAHDVGPAPPVPAAGAPPPSAPAAAPAAKRPRARSGGGLAPPTLLAESGERGFLSPRVRHLIAEHGLKASDLAFIAGSGAGGRITAADIERYVASGEPLPPIRQAVAAGMTKSWTRPLATVAMPVALEALLAHRRSVPGRPSLTVYALRALALALAAGSPFARRLTGSRLHTPASVDLAVAVEVEGGVLTPVIRRVERTALAELTALVETAIERARQGTVADAGEAVGTVSNYGVFGITWATPIPLPGHSVILGLGAPHDQPVWDPQMRGWGRQRRVELTLTFDHRIADGGDAARLLARVAEGLAHPERL